MDKRQRRVFIITLEIKQGCWDYKKGDIIRSAVISNSILNACFAFENKHCGSEYPTYEIIDIEDTLFSGFFAPVINNKNLL